MLFSVLGWLLWLIVIVLCSEMFGKMKCDEVLKCGKMQLAFISCNLEPVAL